MDIDLYLGHTPEYWLELDKRAKELNAYTLLQELVEAKATLAFIQSRLKQINDLEG